VKNYFTKLIDRHRGMAQTVKPRLRSHFEDESGPNQSRLGDDLQTDSTSVQNQPRELDSTLSAPLRGRPVTSVAHASGEIDDRQDGSGASSDYAGSSLGDPCVSEVTQLWEPDPRRIEPEAEVASSSNPLELSSRPADAKDSDSLATISPPQLTDFTVGLNERIEAVLQRLQPHSNSETGEESTATRLGVWARDGIDSFDGRSDKLVSRAPQQDNPADAVSTAPAKFADQYPATQKSSKQSRASLGHLEIPAWVNELQSELSLKNAGTQAPSESVVNVTIGRVEIKAVRELKPPVKSSGKKPSGIMSLDDYLKKRQGKGAS